ncbi:MAG TPA: 4Fe-4S dicluster domain-containing protein [Candidatus Thermoplasmatota archaeon]|nr:4Fe-4S dicluster domain-containing protein [Candidatus Thermoplasmatota archaeon]
MVEISQIQAEASKIFDTYNVQYILGYSNESFGSQTVPFFAKRKKDVSHLVFSPFCVNNLTMYLKNYEGDEKIGIVVKGCDSRSLVQLIIEKRIPRENLVIIGISCGGVIDQKKFQTKFPDVIGPVDVVEKDDLFIFTIAGKNHQVSKKEVLLEKCIHCEYPTPVLYDVLLGEKKQPFGSESYSDVKQIEAKSPQEKWNFWEKQFSRCIRCYACRNICPVCFCKECSAEQLNPQWLRRSVTISENTVWHLTRALHVAGRCTGCGECERVCPMNIPLMLLNKKMLKEVKDLFEYTPGISVDAKPLLAAYKPDDPEDCII